MKLSLWTGAGRELLTRLLKSFQQDHSEKATELEIQWEASGSAYFSKMNPYTKSPSSKAAGSRSLSAYFLNLSFCLAIIHV